MQHIRNCISVSESQNFPTSVVFLCWITDLILQHDQRIPKSSPPKAWIRSNNCVQLEAADYGRSKILSGIRTVKQHHNITRPTYLVLDKPTQQQYLHFSNKALFPHRNYFHFSSNSTVDFPMYFMLNKHSSGNNCLILCETITMEEFDYFGNRLFQHNRALPELIQNGFLLLK